MFGRNQGPRSWRAGEVLAVMESFHVGCFVAKVAFGLLVWIVGGPGFVEEEGICTGGYLS